MERLGYSDTSNIGKLIAHVPDEWAGRNPISVRSENGTEQVRDMHVLTEQGLRYFSRPF